MRINLNNPLTGSHSLKSILQFCEENMSISSNVFSTLQRFGVIKQGKCLMKEQAEKEGINFKKHPAIKFPLIVYLSLL